MNDMTIKTAAPASRGRYDAGVMKYKEMGYWRPDYEPTDTDLIALFRITPQEGVEPDEAAEGRIHEHDVLGAARPEHLDPLGVVALEPRRSVGDQGFDGRHPVGDR